MASSGPGIAYLSGNALSPMKAMTLFSALFVGHSLVSYVGKRSERKSTGPAPVVLDMTVRIGDVLTGLKLGRAKPAEVHSAICAALGILEALARELTGLQKGQISVSLALYEGSSQTQMRLRYRNPGNDRPLGRQFDARNLLAHRACCAGTAPRVVNDLRGFGKTGMKSPTQSAVSYRSFLILPLRRGRNGDEKVIGFLSIDATAPYAFFGNRAKDMIVHSQPIVAHIQELL